MKFARKRYSGGVTKSSLVSSGCNEMATISVMNVTRPSKYPTQILGNGGMGVVCTGCPGESPLVQFISLSTMRPVRVTARPFIRQTLRDVVFPVRVDLLRAARLA